MRSEIEPIDLHNTDYMYASEKDLLACHSVYGGAFEIK